MPDHFGDRELWCDRCKKHIHIPHNQVGGYWHLNSWKNPHGVTFSGGYCSDCFDALHKIKKEV